MEEIFNFPNMPDKTFRHFFKSSDRHIVKRVLESSLKTCRQSISEKYIKTSLNNFHKGIVYFGEGEVKGFVVWKEKTSYIPNILVNESSNTIRYMEVSLICSVPNNIGIGTRLLNDIDNYAIENKFEEITLTPANTSLIDFYRKKGYIINSTHLNKIKMNKKVLPFIIKKTKKTLKKTKIPTKGTNEYYKYLLHPMLHNELNYERLNNIYNTNKK
jgi:hypothetical protein